MRVQKGIRYAQHEPCLLDLYLPDAEQFPVFVYFHGGGLESGSRADIDCLVNEISESEAPVHKTLLNKISGLSPLWARELVFKATGST